MSTSAQQKRHALIFWENHGLKATMDYANVSRSTLYAWRKTARERGVAGLADRSKVPRHRRCRQWPRIVRDRIRHLRRRHPNLGPHKVRVLLAP